MKYASTLYLMSFCAVVLVVGCSTAADDTTVTHGDVTTTETVQDMDASLSGETPASIAKAWVWTADSLEALDSLMASADGYVYYYTFEDLPPGLQLDVSRVVVTPVMYQCALRFTGEGGKRVALDMWPANAAPEDQSDEKKISMDGEVYYYLEEYNETGAISHSVFFWFKDGMRFLVQPDEPITEDVIRRYSELRKVEFNVSQLYVGFGSGVPLIADPDKIESVVRENSGIRYDAAPVHVL